jgi:Protein of unknown function (DUF5818)
VPLRTSHFIDGLLVTGTLSPVLRPDDGGMWRLDLPYRYHNMIDRRVQVEGIRYGCDLLDVTKVTPL